MPELMELEEARVEYLTVTPWNRLKPQKTKKVPRLWWYWPVPVARKAGKLWRENRECLATMAVVYGAILLMTVCAAIL